MPRTRKRTKISLRMKRRGRRSVSPQTQRQISGVVQIALGILLLLALRGQAGAAGLMAQRFLAFFFGAWGVLFPIFLMLSGVLHAFTQYRSIELKRSVGLVLCLVAFLGLMHVGADLKEIGPERDALAGAVGFMVSLPFLLFFSRAVGYVILGSAFLIGLFLAFEPDLASVAALLKRIRRAKRERPVRVAPIIEDLEEETEVENEDDADLIEEDRDAPELNIIRPAFARSVVKEKTEEAIRQQLKKDPYALEMRDTRYEEWTFPALDLLDTSHSELTVNDEELKRQATLIQEKLKEFEIDVTVRDARPGPTVTQFTLEPAQGVKLSKIASLKDDLSLALAAQSLRIEAPIPGKSLVGVEMPNDIRTIVHLREILETSQFTQSTSSLTLPLGRDVSGEAVVASLEDMPHLLIAGATGSGKSVCMNVFLTALLYQNAPHELKLILVDPKRVELVPYNGIPHLLTPVITDADKALQALRWAVAEMGRRLHRFSENGVRNISEYNDKQTDDAKLLPRIVVVVDELADLMMRQFRRDTETMVVRISQMARATGMHLIIATQRPSVDVITGLIKANVPTRIAFRTVSSVDSRTILDGIGAEDLLGRGDMLYMTANTQKPIRVQGIFISTKEVERVINAVKIAGGGKLTEQIGLVTDSEEPDDLEASGGGTLVPRSLGEGGIDLEADDNGGDDLFFEAMRVVQMSGKASASLLQRQLKVGYARAARLLDIMEEKGFIGPPDGAKPRKLYMSRREVEDTTS